MTAVRLLVFAKAPVPGKVKTRLIPALGADGAARLAAHLLGLALRQARLAAVGPVELCMSPAPGSSEWAGVPLPDSLETSDQGEGDLGARMARAARRCLDAGEAVLLTGSDCPELTAAHLAEAARQLASHDAVLIPATDGGYPLLGLARFDARLFCDMPWSTAAVARLTRERMAVLGWRVWIGPPLNDIDTPEDLARAGPIPGFAFEYPDTP